MPMTLDVKSVGLWALIDLTVDPENFHMEERSIVGWHRGRWLIDTGKDYDVVGEPAEVVAVPPEKVFGIFPNSGTPFRLPEPWRAKVRLVRSPSDGAAPGESWMDDTQPEIDARVLAWDGEFWLTDAGPSDDVSYPVPLSGGHHRSLDDEWSS